MLATNTTFLIHATLIVVIICGVANATLVSFTEPPPADLLWRSFSGAYLTAYGGQQRHKLPYARAKERCKTEGGNLVTVWNNTRNDFLKKSFATLFWVGLKCTNPSSCRWSDGKAVSDSTIWLEGEPRVVNPTTGVSRQCGATLSILVIKSAEAAPAAGGVPTDSTSDEVVANDVPPLYLTVHSCDTELGFFCDTVLRPQNATAVYQHKGGYYSMFRSPVLSHSQAEAYCSFYDGGLLKPHSWDEALTVFKLFLYQGYWIGAKGTTDGTNSSMLWEDGSKSPSRWALWERFDTLSINNINGQTSCVSYTEYTGEWYWQDCNQPLQFICQTPVEEEEHEGLVMQVGGASYYFFARPLPFRAAREVCRSIGPGADLAVIRSEQENREVACRAGMVLRGLPYYVGHRGNNHTVLDATAMPYPDPGHKGRWDSRGCMLAGWPGGGRGESSWLNANWWPVKCSASYAFVCKTGRFTPTKGGRFSSPALPPSVPPSAGPSPAANGSWGMDPWRAAKEPPPNSSSGSLSTGVRAAIGVTSSVALVVLLLGALLAWKAVRQGRPLVMPHVIYKTFTPSQDGSSATSRRSCFGAPATKAAATAAGAAATAAGAEHAAPHGGANGAQPHARSAAQPGITASRELPGGPRRPARALHTPNGTRQQPLSLTAAGNQPQVGFVPQAGVGSRSAAAALGAAGVDMGLQMERDLEVQWGRLLGRGTSGAVYAGQLRGLPVAVKVLLREPSDGWQAESRASSRRNSVSGPSPPMPPMAIAAAAAEALGGLHADAAGGTSESQESQRAQGTAAALKLGNFRQEALILTHLRHPNVVALHGGCLEGQDVFLAYELMECSLADLLHARSTTRPLPLERVLEIVRGVACGLWQLHPHIIHCDLKSANVLLDGQGTAKISDFGVAHISTSGLPSATAPAHIAGTLPYMAPERLQGQPISDKCDVYSLGVILWECLARRKPWHGLDKLSIIYQVCMERKRPEIPTDDAGWPPEVCTLIERCWSHDLRDRPTAAELVKRLSALLARLRLGDPLRGRGAAGSAPPPGAGSSIVLSPAPRLAPPPDGGQGAGDERDPYSFPGPAAMSGAGRDLAKQSRGGNLVDPQQLLQSDELGGSDSDSSAMFSTGSFSQPVGE